jgi:hypothetical protein
VWLSPRRPAQPAHQPRAKSYGPIHRWRYLVVAATDKDNVRKGDIAPGAVTAKKLARGAVHTKALAKGALVALVDIGLIDLERKAVTPSAPPFTSTSSIYREVAQRFGAVASIVSFACSRPSAGSEVR